MQVVGDYNLTKNDQVIKMFQDIKPNIVIHLAALVGGVHHNIEEPVKYFEENVLMNTFVLKESYKFNNLLKESNKYGFLNTRVDFKEQNHIADICYSTLQ